MWSRRSRSRKRTKDTYVRVRVGESTQVFGLSAIYQYLRGAGLKKVTFPFEYHILDYITDNYATLATLKELQLLLDWYHETIRPVVSNEYRLILELDRGHWTKGGHFMTVSKRLICEADCDPDKCLRYRDPQKSCPKVDIKAELYRLRKLTEVSNVISTMSVEDLEDLLAYVRGNRE